MAQTATFATPTSALCSLRPMDSPDALEAQWHGQYVRHLHDALASAAGSAAAPSGGLASVAAAGVDAQLSALLQQRATESMDRHAEITQALLYGMLAAPAAISSPVVGDAPPASAPPDWRAQTCFRHLTYVVRDGFAYCVQQLVSLVAERYPRLLDSTRHRLVCWLLPEVRCGGQFAVVSMRLRTQRARAHNARVCAADPPQCARRRGAGVAAAPLHCRRRRQRAQHVARAAAAQRVHRARDVAARAPNTRRVRATARTATAAAAAATVAAASHHHHRHRAAALAATRSCG